MELKGEWNQGEWRVKHPSKGEWKRIFNKLNLDKPYCQEFKAQLDQFESVRQAFLSLMVFNSGSFFILHKYWIFSNELRISSRVSSLNLINNSWLVLEADAIDAVDTACD